MSSDNATLNERVAQLEERMNTMNERYDKGLALLREDIAKRDKANIQWIVGTVFGATVLIISVLSFLLLWPK